VRLSNGAVFRYPAGSNVQLAYFERAAGQHVTPNRDGCDRLVSLEDLAGRLLTYDEGPGDLWGGLGRLCQLTYPRPGRPPDEGGGPIGCEPQYAQNASHLLAVIVD
jgi:hypothetical protein